MKEEKGSATATGNFKCTMCNQTFQTQQELQDHNRDAHQPKSGKDTGSGAEQQYPSTERNPGAERKPGMNMEQEWPSGQRKGPGYGQESGQEPERPEQIRKRAAS